MYTDTDRRRHTDTHLRKEVFQSGEVEQGRDPLGATGSQGVPGDCRPLLVQPVPIPEVKPALVVKINKYRSFFYSI